MITRSNTSENNIHILFVAHGSRNKAWVSMQKKWWIGVNRILRQEAGRSITSELSFLEISPMLFEDRLKRWKRENPSRKLFVFPFFLSQSGHTTEDIPPLIEDNFPEAHLVSVQSKDWAGVLARNFERRLQNYGAHPDDPVIISCYGASKHNGRWRKLIHEIQSESEIYRNKSGWMWAPSGHFLKDSEAPLRCHLNSAAIRYSKKCAILPMYLGMSSYQEKLIPGVLEKYDHLEILTGKDAILPDPEIEKWAADLAMKETGFK